MNTTQWPAGLVTPLLTPFAGDELDADALAGLVERQVAAGVAGVIVGGGSGEFGTLTVDERRRAAEVTLEALAGRLPMLVQTGALATRDAVALGTHAETIGAAGLMIASPFGEPISWRERKRFYEDVTAASSLPVMIYNTPPSGLLSLAQIEELATLPNVSAIKDSSGDATALGDLLAWAADRDFAVYDGWDNLLDFAMERGAHGIVVGVANVIPAEVVRVMDAITAGSPDAGPLWIALRIWVRAMESCSNYIAMCKALVRHDGLDLGDTRAPYLMPDADEVSALAAATADLKAAFAASSPR